MFQECEENEGEEDWLTDLGINPEDIKNINYTQVTFCGINNWINFKLFVVFFRIELNTKLNVKWTKQIKA